MNPAGFEDLLNDLQMKETMKFTNALVERCFHGCANDFSSRSLTSKESKCMYSCVDKFMRLQMRLGRLSTEQIVLNNQQQQQQQQQK